MYTTAASSAPNESRADTEEDTESIDVREKYLKTAKHDVRPFVSEQTKMRYSAATNRSRLSKMIILS